MRVVNDMDNVEEIVARIVAELRRLEAGNDVTDSGGVALAQQPGTSDSDLVIDLPDPTTPQMRTRCGIENPADPEGARNLIASTSARICVGRAGARPRTETLLLFQADHGVTQDAIYGVVGEETKEQFDLFTVQSAAADREVYLLRPDLGRRLSDEGRRIVDERCVKNPDVQIVVGDGLSAAAVTNNLPNIYPVIAKGLAAAGLSTGTPFFVENCRVGIMNDINSIIHAKVIVLLLGERPGLGIADAMSAYMGFDPEQGKSDADRDLICMITVHGGTNPLEAGAYIVDYVKRMIKYSASGIKLREILNSSGE